jgi:hypothetical protein
VVDAITTGSGFPSTAVNWTGDPIPGGVDEPHPIMVADAMHPDITNTKPTLFILIRTPRLVSQRRLLGRIATKRN